MSNSSDKSSAQGSSMSSTRVAVLSILGSVGAFALVGIGVVLGSKYFPSSAPVANSVLSTATVTSTAALTSTPTASSVPQISIISGQMKRLNQDLNLFKDHPTLGQNTGITYYEAGTFNDGIYKDYKRVVAFVPPMELGPIENYTFATKDYVTFVLHADPKDVTDFPEDHYRNPYNLVNKQKMSAVSLLPKSHPDILPVNDTFVLLTDADPLAADGKMAEVVDYSVYQQLPFSNSQYRVYAARTPAEVVAVRQNNPDMPGSLGNVANVIVVDESGLGYHYHLAFKKDAASYLLKKQQYNQEEREYEKEVMASQNGQSASTPVGQQAVPPDPLTIPSLHFAVQAIRNAQPNMYSSYGNVFDHFLGFRNDVDVVENVKIDDVKQIGEINGAPLYAFADKNHPLVSYFYQQKIAYLPDDYFRNSINESKPDLATYSNNTPLVLIKDPWDRWVVLQENKYEVLPEVGKPVVYLYPQTETEVKVELTTPIDFSVTIPAYHNGWRVLAKPNGELKDLQPEFTDCSRIDTSHVGSEYALAACQQNQYPYIYWAGRPLATQYPTVDTGWVIANENIEQFMHEKLDEIGLTATEKQDMLTYWLPKMKAKQAPFYRVSFLQDAVMDKLAPMKITPQPDTIARVFLDFQPLTQSRDITPQELTKIVRHGFTVVEWGGLKY